MEKGFTYEEYVTDESFLSQYHAYQKRHREKIKESDRVIVNLVGELLAGPFTGKQVKCLDVGCSTGNLAFHLRNQHPALPLTAGDMDQAGIERCKSDSGLAGINFEVIDMLAIPYERSFDIIISNAVLYMFKTEQYERAVASVFKALAPGGRFIVFDFAHPFEQDLTIHEVSRSHPNGLDLHFRPYRYVRDALTKAGFAAVEFRPFIIPIDLPKGVTYGDNSTGFEDINSYTVKDETGQRMLFRGALAQPWCHIVASKQ